MMKSRQLKVYEALGYVNLYENERNEIFGRLKDDPTGRYSLPSLNSWDGFGLIWPMVQESKYWDEFRKEICYRPPRRAAFEQQRHLRPNNFIKAVYINPTAFFQVFYVWLETKGIPR